MRFGGRPILLSAMSPTNRQPIYASLTGSSSSLLGFAIAAVAILSAFRPRTRKSEAAKIAERRVAAARDRLVISLLATSMFLLVLLVASSLAIATDGRRIGNS